MRFFTITKIIFLFFLIGCKAKFNLKYIAPHTFPINSNATLTCGFAAELGKVYNGSWSKSNSDHDFERIGGVFNSKEDISKVESYFYKNMPTSLEGRFYHKPSHFLDGRMQATIQKISIGDDAVYQCHLEQERYTRSKTFTIEVFNLPEEIYVVDKKINFVYSETDENEEIVATCSVKGVYPVPKAMWFISNNTGLQISVKDFQHFQNSDGTFDLTGNLTLKISPEFHNDFFTCYIKMGVHIDGNDVIKSSNETSTILIKHKSRMASLKIEPNPAEEGKEIVFICQFDGYPTNVTITNFDESLVIAQAVETTENFISGKMIITKNMKGKYKCLAGNVTSFENLDVHWISDKVEIFRNKTEIIEDFLVLEKDEDLSLFCSISGNPKPVVEWKTDNMTTVGGSLQISNTSIKDSGAYTCISGDIKRVLNVQIEAPCAPYLQTEVSSTIDDLEAKLVIKVACVATGNPACQLLIKADIDLGVAPQVDQALNHQMFTYVGVEHLSKSPTFTCTASNKLSSTGKMYNVMVNETVTDKVLTTQPLKSQFPWLLVVIGALAFIILLLLSFIYHQSKQQKFYVTQGKSDEDGYTATEEMVPLSDPRHHDHRLNNSKPMRTFSIKSTSPNPPIQSPVHG